MMLGYKAMSFKVAVVVITLQSVQISMHMGFGFIGVIVIINHRKGFEEVSHELKCQETP